MTSTTEGKATTPARRRSRAIANTAAATVVAVVVLMIANNGFASIPAVGRMLNPGTGVWTDAAHAGLPTDSSVTVPGIRTPTTVTFDSTGVAHVVAGSDQDFFRAIGYTEARFRIFQMDLMRRQAGGSLAEVLGPNAVQSDEFELDIGLRRDAQRDWTDLPASAPARAALVSYAAGANAAISEMKRDHTLPMYFTMLGYQPAPWTPVDSFLVQRLETQSLSLDDSPLAYNNIAKGLGTSLFDKWFQAAPQNDQHPFDPGPYRKLPLEPLSTSDPSAPKPAPTSGWQATTSAKVWHTASSAAQDLLHRMAGLPFNTIHSIGNSNEWVVSGSRTASGKPILASDPHLKLSLPSFWFEFTAQSPSYRMAGVGLPGIPVILIGRTPTISWGITNSQHGSTYYYLEKTDKSRPGQYYWKGAWRHMSQVATDIKVKHHSSIHHITNLTVHGPVMTLQDVTASVWWTGSLPSDDLDSMLQAVRATNFAQFREALRGWHTPAEDFAYADSAGNIGIVNAGYAPQVASGKPWLPLSGTGASDVVGSVPYDALPSVYNPPSGIAASANQREVSTSYPYYWGRDTAFFDQGWRTSEILRGIGTNDKVTVGQTEQLQLSSTDGVARALAPTLMAALKGMTLDKTEQAAADALSSWNFVMGQDSAAATVWSSFIPRFDADVWDPIASAYHIVTPPDFPRSTAQGVMVNDAIRGMLIKLAASDPGNAVFAPPGKADRTATDVLRQAFEEGVKDLVAQDGSDPERVELRRPPLRDDRLDPGRQHAGLGSVPRIRRRAVHQRHREPGPGA